MILERIKTPGIAHVAWLLGSRGRAALVDPRRDLDAYLGLLREKGLRLEYVLVTHRQEDFVMGAVALARRTGAKVVAARHPLTAYADVPVEDGTALELGEVRLVALRTPGHTPESTSYAVYLREAEDRAWGVFTGDALFIGAAGRTDLVAEDETAKNAGLLYDSIHQKLAPLGEQALIFPAHGSGSVCGSNIASRDDSTLGMERRTNSAFTSDRDAFIREKLQERLPRPPYFRRMEDVNLRGGKVMDVELEAIPWMSPAEFDRARADGRAQVIDTREPEAFAGGHVPGALSVWLEGLPIFGGWVGDSSRPVLLVLERDEDVETALRSLARIGIDSVRGVLRGGMKTWRTSGLPLAQAGTISAEQLQHVRERFQVLDVREISEFESGHIPGALWCYVGDLERTLPRLSLRHDGPIAVTCSVGHRAGLAASLLRREGFAVFNLLGGMKAWLGRGFEVREGPAAREAGEGAALPR